MITKIAYGALILGLALLLAACPSDDGTVCAADADCPAGRYCQGGDCAFDCTYNEDCPDGYRCTVRGRCERGCVPSNNGVEACDLVDNDCDELTDEDFVDLGLACDLGCGPGEYVCTSDSTGTECTARAPAESDESCDGLDDDCDDLTDEDAPDIPCPVQDGVCAGAAQVCLESGQYSECDYGADYTQDLDANCDGRDEDCDGQTDEDALILSPELGAQASDGVDNNCNGLIDEPGGVMVPAKDNPGVWIDAYETTVFASPDCTGQRYGEDLDDYPPTWPIQGDASTQLYACSLAEIVPSGFLSWYRADRACRAQGKRLCWALEWEKSCRGEGNDKFPYGSLLFVPGICNDFRGGSGQVMPSGSYEGCVTVSGIFDLSGNMNEWLQDEPAADDCTGAALTTGSAYFCELCECGLECTGCDDPADDQRLENLYDCGAGGERKYEQHYLDRAPAHFGSRCCYEP